MIKTEIENNQKNRLSSIYDAIGNYNIQIKYNDSSKKADNVNSEIKQIIEDLENEINILKKRENQYIFNGKTLEVYVSNEINTFQILKLDGKFYLIKNNQPFILNGSLEPTPFTKVQDSLIKNQLDDLLFKNGLPTVKN